MAAHVRSDNGLLMIFLIECPKVIPYFGHSLTTCWATYAQRMFTEGPARVHRVPNAWSMSAQRMVMVRTLYLD